jgi:hypothetical protein
LGIYKSVQRVIDDELEVKLMAGNDNPQPDVPAPTPTQGGPQPNAPTATPSGMNVEVTPLSPLTMGQIPARKIGKSHLPIILIAVAVVLILFGVLYMFVISPPHKTTTTTTSSIPQGGQSFSSCQSITSPGKYYLTSNLKYAQQSGACITVNASNVEILCTGTSIQGSGPYSALPPFSYGVEAANQKNITINGCAIGNFSYGVYALSDKNIVLTNSNVTHNYASDLYLNHTSNSTFAYDYITNSGSQWGAVQITNGSSGNQFLNNSLTFNPYYGFNISASGERFLNNYVVESASGFYCSPLNGFPNSSLASGNTCDNNTGCGFVSCKSNIPANISKVALGYQIATCGTIHTPGTHYLSGNLDLMNFMNINRSAMQQYAASCINVASRDVRLDCNNHSISNAYIGININGQTNFTLSDCNVQGTTYGAYADDANNTAIDNSTFNNNSYSVEVQSSAGYRLDNVSVRSSGYGINLINASAGILTNIGVIGSKYGVFLSGSLGNVFNGGSVTKSSAMDIYATADSANSSDNFMSGTTCNFTNAQWANCGQYLAPNSTSYPISFCQNIVNSGNYVLQQSFIGAYHDCIDIKANNVNLNCQGNLIQGTRYAQGPAILVSGRKNITINDCRIGGFTSGLDIYNVTNAIVVNDSYTGSPSNYGFNFSNVTRSVIRDNHIINMLNVSLNLQHVTYTNVSLNNISYGVNKSIDVLVSNSTLDSIVQNNGQEGKMGIALVGQSQNNTISNNTFATSKADYYCAPEDGALNDGNGGVNTGISKSGCEWMAVVPQGAQALPCVRATGTTLISLTNDQSYGFNATCFTSVANYTTINCNGHTVLAQNGGTFADVLNGTGITVENCYLKGFNNFIDVSGSNSTQVLNNTIYSNATSSNSTTYAISVVRVNKPYIRENSVLTGSGGIEVRNSNYGNLAFNNVSAGTTAYALYNTTGMNVFNNAASATSGIGALLYNTVTDIFYNNAFFGVSGLVCQGSSQGTNEDTDTGGNSCSSVSSCSWITQSSATCH